MKKATLATILVFALCSGACGNVPPTGTGGTGGTTGAGGTAGAPDSGQPATPVAIPVTGTGTTAGDAGGIPVNLTGVLNVDRFTNQNGQLVAIGTLSGTITNAAGAVLGTLTNQAVTLPVTTATGSCQVLALDLGPLHLDLLGLVVDLNALHLNITAQPGPGNLVGNLLCAVANLLNGGGLLTSITGLLNQLLGALGGTP